MTNNCVVCGVVIPEGLQVCPNCEKQEIIRMKWEQIAFCNWKAAGKSGTFRVWKEGKVWKGTYRSTNGQHTCFFKEQKSLRKIQTLCEQSKYWE